MKNLKKLKLFKKQIIRFIIVGSLTVCIDFLCYRTFLQIKSNVEVAKAIGFITGTIFSYLANRSWTFKHSASGISSITKFSIVYASTLAVNVIANSLLLKLLPHTSDSIKIAFFIATALSAALNFIGMKFFVFTNNTKHKIP